MAPPPINILDSKIIMSAEWSIVNPFECDLAICLLQDLSQRPDFANSASSRQFRAVTGYVRCRAGEMQDGKT